MVWYDEEDDSFVVSLAHQNMLVKVDRETGKLKWRLGADGDFSLNGAGGWFSYQHGADLLPNRNILLYDHKADDFVHRSRVVEYALNTTGGDREDWTADQVWEYLGKEPFYSVGPADVDSLPNGNLLILHGSLVTDPELEIWDPKNQTSARIVELVRSDTPEEVFVLEIFDRDADDPESYTVFALERIEGLYPGSWKVTAVN